MRKEKSSGFHHSNHPFKTKTPAGAGNIRKGFLAPEASAAFSRAAFWKKEKPDEEILREDNMLRRKLRLVSLGGLLSALLVTSSMTAEGGINSWTSIGPEAGSIAALAIDPVTPGTLYASVRGRVRLQAWRSDDSSRFGATGYLVAATVLRREEAPVLSAPLLLNCRS